jgi:hypothetical protein
MGQVTSAATTEPAPPDAVCDVCGEPIRKGTPRFACAGGAECDDFDACEPCAQTAAVKAAHTHSGTSCLFRTIVSRADSIDSVFAGAPSSAAVVLRALKAFDRHPAVAEVDCEATPPSLRWRSYFEIGAAIDIMSRALHHAAVEPDTAVVAICAPNSVGWIVADFACAVARLPTACVDDTLAVVDAAAAAAAAAEQVGRTIQLAIIADVAAPAWSAELGLAPSVLRPHSAEDAPLLLRGLALAADAHSAAASAYSFVELASSRAAHRKLAAARELAADAPLTAMFTSGSTGVPKPRWITADNWTTRNPQSATVTRVSSVGVFSPLSHGLGRRQVWRELTHGGRVGLLDASAGSVVGVEWPTFLCRGRFFCGGHLLMWHLPPLSCGRCERVVAGCSSRSPSLSRPPSRRCPPSGPSCTHATNGYARPHAPKTTALSPTTPPRWSPRGACSAGG